MDKAVVPHETQPPEPHESLAILRIGDQGATSPDPTPSTLDPEPSSAFGGVSSTRSNTRTGPDPAEEGFGAESGR